MLAVRRFGSAVVQSGFCSAPRRGAIGLAYGGRLQGRQRGRGRGRERKANPASCASAGDMTSSCLFRRPRPFALQAHVAGCSRVAVRRAFDDCEDTKPASASWLLNSGAWLLDPAKSGLISCSATGIDIFIHHGINGALRRAGRGQKRVLKFFQPFMHRIADSVAAWAGSRKRLVLQRAPQPEA